jgi:hypothetical protein
VGKKDKKIGKIVEDFSKKYFDSNFVRPIFAHASVEPVKAREDLTDKVSSSLSHILYHYAIFYFLNENGQYEINIFIKIIGNEEPPIFEEYTFDLSQSQEMFHHFTIPSRMFYLDGVRKRAISFKDVAWSREYLLDYINLWMRNSQTWNW